MEFNDNSLSLFIVRLSVILTKELLIIVTNSFSFVIYRFFSFHKINLFEFKSSLFSKVFCCFTVLLRLVSGSV